MKVRELEPGDTFRHNGQQYIKTRAKFNEDICLEVKNDGKSYYVASEDCAAVNVETGELEFIKDEIVSLELHTYSDWDAEQHNNDNVAWLDPDA